MPVFTFFQKYNPRVFGLMFESAFNVFETSLYLCLLQKNPKHMMKQKV